ncbi:response regulator transcription factor [Gorillibacterium sp. sgz5001074]|uniref:response regulator transcription factor n=1 Tax=Gorillibacterium sp. sgz5001074 TaxID=3446695 RepID=UPI003F669E38
MYQALIAEDSKPIQRNIRALVEASGLPVEVAATASNGEEALELLGGQAIDILLTDIRMPRMDGLTLIEQAKKLNPRLKAVLISGYNDFEYTRKALNLQVNDYLLKPVEPSQLSEVMERIIGLLREEQSGGEYVLDGIVELESDTPPGPDFFEQPKLLWVAYWPPFPPLAVPEAGGSALMLRSVLGDVFAGNPYWVFPARDISHTLILAHASYVPDRSGTPETAKRIHARLLTLHPSVSLAYHPAPVEAARLHERYRDLSLLLVESGPLFVPALMDGSLPPRDSRASPPGETSDRLAEPYSAMIHRLQKERFLLQLNEQLNKWRRSAVTAAELERFVYRLAEAFESMALAHMGRKDWDVREEVRLLFGHAGAGQTGSGSGQSGSGSGQTGYEEFCTRLLRLFGECFDFVQNANKKSGTELFEKIDEHLRTNLYAQVTMGDLSARFHVSSSYISRVVKRYSQSTFVSYYLELKIREARRLMEARPEMKIKEISDALCFHDQHYFSKVFKEYAGYSPTEYKAALAVTDR